MKLSTKARYAVMAMADIAAYGDGAPIPSAVIAGRQRISQSYLEQLFARLRRAGLVNSARGPGGGYLLTREAAAISINEIVRAVNPPIRATRCDGSLDSACLGDNRRCLTHDLWQALGDRINSFLSSVSLADVVEGRLVAPRPCALRVERQRDRPAMPERSHDDELKVTV